MVSITYGHGYLNDWSVVTGWSESEDGNTISQTILHGDYLDIEVTGSAGNKVAYFVNDDNLALSTTTYTKIRWRYKTSSSSIKAKIVLEFSDASTQTVLDQTDSTTQTCGSATITAAKTLDHIRLHADAATGHVYYDFVLVYKGDFTIPDPDAITPSIPIDEIVNKPPGMAGARTQGLGSGLAEWLLECDFSTGTWTRTIDVADADSVTHPGQVFMDLAHNSGSEPWQWFDSDIEQCKIRMDQPRFPRTATPEQTQWRFICIFREFRYSDASNGLETYATRWGLNL